MTLQAIADLINARIDADPTGGSLEIRRVAKIEEAGAGDITFLANPKYVRFLATTNASAVIVGLALKGIPEREGRGPALLRVHDPYLSFVRVLAAFHPPPDPVRTGDPSHGRHRAGRDAGEGRARRRLRGHRGARCWWVTGR